MAPRNNIKMHAFKHSQRNGRLNRWSLSDRGAANIMLSTFVLCIIHLHNVHKHLLNIAFASWPHNCASTLIDLGQLLWDYNSMISFLMLKSRHTENRCSRNERLQNGNAVRGWMGQSNKLRTMSCPQGGVGSGGRHEVMRAYVEGRTAPQAPLREPELTPKPAVVAREPGAGWRGAGWKQDHQEPRRATDAACYRSARTLARGVLRPPGNPCPAQASDPDHATAQLLMERQNNSTCRIHMERELPQSSPG